MIDHGSLDLTIPLSPVTRDTYDDFIASASDAERRWLASQRFKCARHSFCCLPDATGGIAKVLVGVEEGDPFALAHLPGKLPPGRYRLEGDWVSGFAATLGWRLGAYRFDRYRSRQTLDTVLVIPESPETQRAGHIADAVLKVRDLVNTPTEDMGPADLATTIRDLAQGESAEIHEWVGEALLTHGFPAIHAVGRASHRPPRLIELTWGDPAHPRLAVIGKGVCFDTGGLDIKSADGMRLMKKDMGGAAHAIALAQLIMRLRLPVRLQLLVPAVENAIAGNAYRPGEVVHTRKGHRVEIHNTDAEGRVILADAIAYAAEAKPDLIVDFATLTGAARVALGPELPALFCNRDALALALTTAGEMERDPLWRMPLYGGYRRLFESDIADFTNASKTTFAGAVTAALFLENFVPNDLPWVHIDVFSWNDISRPGRPAGGEAQSLRSVFAALEARYREIERA
jgi:leucyl aminopeptidase